MQFVNLHNFQNVLCNIMHSEFANLLTLTLILTLAILRTAFFQLDRLINCCNISILVMLNTLHHLFENVPYVVN